MDRNWKVTNRDICGGGSDARTCRDPYDELTPPAVADNAAAAPSVELMVSELVTNAQGVATHWTVVRTLGPGDTHAFPIGRSTVVSM